MGRDQIGHYQFHIESCRSRPALQSRSSVPQISLVRPAFARSHKSKAMLSFTHPSNSYDGTDRDSRADHELILIGYACCVVGSPQARMTDIIGDLLCPTKAGDDAYVTYGRGLSVILHAALPPYQGRARISPFLRELTQGHCPR